MPGLSTKSLYIIRHGQTEYNRQHMVQGSGIDADLNDAGRDQARRFFMRYAGEGFKRVYTSQLKRTHQSVQKFLELGLPWEVLPGLNEISWGEKEGRVITPEDDSEYFRILSAWSKGQTSLAFKGGESPDAVAQRLQTALDQIMSRPDEDKVLICMHGRALRIFLCLLLRYPLGAMEAFEHSNLCLYKLNYTGSRFSIEMGNVIV